MHDFTPVPALVGGALIGASASLFLLTHGKVAGVSGLYAEALRPGSRSRGVGIAFVAGLLVSGVVVRLVRPDAFVTAWAPSLPVAALAGLLVGVGTQIGSGCTSGHGVCGVSRLSVRSLVATATFMALGILAVFVVRRAFGGSP